MTIKPVAVLTSDVHYNFANLELADNALRQAIKRANELNVQLWICGDLHDTKANIRAECLNRLIKTLMLADKKPRILVGNHDKINEKSEDHALTVLDGFYAEVIDKPIKTNNGTYFIPYFSELSALKLYLSSISARSLLIMHQGIHGSNMGDYVLDKSALLPEDVAGHRVISGHYHARQTIKLPEGGIWDYIGSPYTMSYGEANDPEKGFQILMDDGSLEFIPTNLRRHVVIETDGSFKKPIPLIVPKNNDLVWVKIKDTKEELSTVTRLMVQHWLDIAAFRLDLIPTEAVTIAPKANLSKSDIMDSLIDSLTNTSEDCKIRLKDKWRTYV